jgi:hypothetical protein
MISRRRVARATAVASLVVVLAACAYGVSGGADQITPASARIHGQVGDTDAGWASYWFEYGTTEAYGRAFFPTQVEIGASDATLPVSALLGNLTDGTEYHYRLCAEERYGNQEPVCGEDRTFTTPEGDTVWGSGDVGYVPGPGGIGFAPLGGSLKASSEPGGANPQGTAQIFPSWDMTSSTWIIDSGSVTCLNVVGNQASARFSKVRPGQDTLHYLVFVEDNGATGDRLGTRLDVDDPDDCPDPTDADFAPWPFIGTATLVSGDFVVHDHDAPH